MIWIINWFRLSILWYSTPTAQICAVVYSCRPIRELTLLDTVWSEQTIPRPYKEICTKGDNTLHYRVDHTVTHKILQVLVMVIVWSLYPTLLYRSTRFVIRMSDVTLSSIFALRSKDVGYYLSSIFTYVHTRTSLVRTASANIRTSSIRTAGRSESCKGGRWQRAPRTPKNRGSITPGHLIGVTERIDAAGALS